MKRKTFLLLAVLLCSIGLQATAFPSRTDFRDESIYFVMTTRFYNGDPSNDTQCWEAQQYNVGDPAWRGDFKGLIKQMDYIKALGFTAIWITPIVTNGSGYDYHGYHAMNFSEVDKRYESEDVLFQDVIDAAHARGMKIILDIVLNHTGNFGEEKLCKLFITVHEFFLAVHYIAVTPVLVMFPKMSVNRESDSAILSEHIHEFTLDCIHCRLWIMMTVLNISAEFEVSS